MSSSSRPLTTKGTTNARGEHPCLERDSNPPSQQSSGISSTHSTARPSGDWIHYIRIILKLLQIAFFLDVLNRVKLGWVADVSECRVFILRVRVIWMSNCLGYVCWQSLTPVGGKGSGALSGQARIWTRNCYKCRRHTPFHTLPAANKRINIHTEPPVEILNQRQRNFLFLCELMILQFYGHHQALFTLYRCAFLCSRAIVGMGFEGHLVHCINRREFMVKLSAK